MIINNKSRQVINYFLDRSFKQRLTDYPAVNAAGQGLTADMQGYMREIAGSDARATDLFDMFCHWLVAEKKHLPVGSRGERIHVSGGQVTATVPEDEHEDVAAPESAVTRESYKVQAALAEIGAKMRYQIWIPRNDRVKVLEQYPALRSVLLDELPLNYITTTLKTIEQIDVIWIRRHSIARAFEVEHTTAVYSGLLRMADLLSLQPDINIRLHIVAPDEKHNKVMREIKRPIFSSLEKGPLYRRCSYIAYSSVAELRNLPRLEHMNDSVLNDYEEFAEEE